MLPSHSLFVGGSEQFKTKKFLFTLDLYILIISIWCILPFDKCHLGYASASSDAAWMEDKTIMTKYDLGDFDNLSVSLN